MAFKVLTRTGTDGKKYHQISSDASVECNGQDCNLCKQELEETFQEWEQSVPIPLPPEGKKYKKKRTQRNRGKTIMEICYSCKVEDAPCYICRRGKCESWMKEEARKGQEEGCASWENGRCVSFDCVKRLIKTTWHSS